jgi:PAS domain S-box-containing protein
VVEEPFTLPSGDVLWYETRKRPLVAPDGKTYVLAVATDVTARRAAERTLEETRERLGLAVKAGRLGVWDWNVVTGEVYFDAEYKAMLGYDDHDFANRFDAWYEALHPDDRDRALVHVERAVADPRAHDFEHEFRLRTKAGEYRWIFGAATITRDDTGRATRVTGFHSDVHDRKAREDALRAANEGLARAARMKDEFLANMSHELRTPLNGVLGHAELLAEEVHGPLSDAQRRAVATIEASGLHLLRLINDVLDLARLEAGKLELVRQNVDVSELCQRALANVRREALHKSLKVAFAEKGIARPLLADPRRCEQMVASLLENAVRFTPTGGRIGLEVHAGEDALAITVWDTGIGVPPGEVDRIFQPFVQLDGGLARQHGGTGLGLPLVRRLAELHGGSLRVETAEGAGSRFVLTLPHAPASRPPQ